MRGRVPIQRNRLRRTLALDRLAEEGLGRSDVPFGAQMEVDCLAGPVDSAVQVAPLASNLHVRLVNAPGPSHRSAPLVPALDELGCVALHPAHDRRVRKRQAPLGHHLHQVSQAQLEPQVPPHAHDDDFAAKWRPSNNSSMLFSLLIADLQCVQLASVAEGAGEIAPEPSRPRVMTIVLAFASMLFSTNSAMALSGLLCDRAMIRMAFQSSPILSLPASLGRSLRAVLAAVTSNRPRVAPPARLLQPVARLAR